MSVSVLVFVIYSCLKYSYFISRIICFDNCSLFRKQLLKRISVLKYCIMLPPAPLFFDKFCKRTFRTIVSFRIILVCTGSNITFFNFFLSQ